jgi:hypothetical protein
VEKLDKEDLKFINQAIYDYIDDDENLVFHKGYILAIDLWYDFWGI